MNRVTALLHRFRKDERGVFMVFFAVMAIVLIATSGAVVDFSRVQQSRTRAQTALDAAALALQGKIATQTATQLKASAQSLLTERIGDASITAEVDSAVPDVNNGKLTLNAHIVVPTYFVQLVGITSIRSTMLSEVTRSSSDLEVSLSLDVTGSMAATYNWWGTKTSDKIGDLISATNTLIDLLVSDTQTPTYSKMAIVPWSAGVNLGSTYAGNVRGTPNTATKNITAASWSTGSAKSISGVTRGWSSTTINSSSHGFSVGDTIYISNISGVSTGGWSPSSCINGGAYVITSKTTNSYTISLNTGSCTSYSSGGTGQKCQVANCEMVITSNNHGKSNGAALYITNVSGATGINGPAFAANVTTNTMSLAGTFGPTAGTYSSGGKIWCGDHGCSYRTFHTAAGGTNGFAVSTCVSERTTNAYTDAAPSTTLLNMNYPPSGQCVSQEVQPLTSNKTTLHALANSLTATGSTAGHLGLAWGWYMISPNFAYLWPVSSRPKAYGSANLVKAVVFMTDGVFNTAYNSGVVAQNSLSGSGSDSDHINQDASNGLSKAQAETLCDSIKAPANKTLLYVVGFDLATDETTRDFLQDCATSEDYFYRADTGTDLAAAFKSIAQSLSELRVSK